MPSISPHPDVEIPNVDVWSFFFEQEEGYEPDKPFFVDALDSTRFLTYRTLKQASASFGAALRTQWNWQKGDVLGIFGLNDIDYVTVTFGALWAGGTVSPMSFSFNAEELAYQLKNSGTKAIVVHPQGLKIVEEAARQVGLPTSRILLFGKEGLSHEKYKHFLRLSGSQSPPRWKIDPAKDLSVLVYSSGTTGFPKGVCLSHRNIVAQLCQLLVTEFGATSPGYETRVLAFLPFSHIYALTNLVLRPVLPGMPTYIMPRFDLETALRSIQNHKITYTYLAPPVALAFAKHPLVDKYNLASLGGVMCAAAPLATQLIDDVYKRLKLPVKQAYGLSETAPAITIQALSEAMVAKGSVGKLIPNQILKVVNAEGAEVSSGEPGEIWVKGPNVFLGYLNNEEATRNTFSDDGYFKTGDVGYQDAKGNLYITDRVKELIKYRGYQVAPAELEAILLKNPKVADTAVLGIYDDSIASEVPRAFIKLAEGLTPSKALGEAIADAMNAQVSYPKKLRGGVQFVDEIPKSATGKILRRVLKDKYGARISEPPKSKL